MIVDKQSDREGDSPIWYLVGDYLYDRPRLQNLPKHWSGTQLPPFAANTIVGQAPMVYKPLAAQT